MIDAKVSTHQPRQHLSRLGQFRLKDAARRRDLAIADAHDNYAREVRAILGQDRAATLAYREAQGACVGAVPAISNPFGHALDVLTHRRWWTQVLPALLGGASS